MSSISRLSMRASMGESGLRVLPEMFKHKLLQSSEETVTALQRIWREAGYEEAECQRLLGDLLNKIKTTCAAEVVAEQQILDHAKLQIESSIQELRELSGRLGRTPSVEYLQSMHCTDQLAELEKLLSEVSAEVNGRQAALDNELDAVNALVSELGETPPSESEFRGPAGTPLLSDVRLQLLRTYRTGLEALRNQRVQEMKEIAYDAFSHMSDLLYAEEGFATMRDAEEFLNLDKQIARFGKLQEFAFSLHKEQGLGALTRRCARFIEEKEKRRNELARTGEEIARLWTLLRVPSVERDAFQNSFKKNLSMETLSRGMDELARLREIRRTSLGRVVTSIRNDIVTLWEEAGIESEESRKKEFAAFFDDVDSLEDSSVEVHETYFNALRARVEELKPILLKISRRETVIQERIELEHLQMNPERLTARGPNAREERKREEAMTNRVKNLEKLTKEIVSQVSVWEESNGPFVYAGERYVERISRQDENYIEIRDTLRNARKKKDGKAETLTSTKTLPAKRTLGSSTHVPATPHTSTLRSTKTTTTTVTAQAVPPPAPVDLENVPPSRSVNVSRDSDSTIYTSLTEVKDRSSTGSITVVRETR